MLNQTLFNLIFKNIHYFFKTIIASVTDQEYFWCDGNIKDTISCYFTGSDYPLLNGIFYHDSTLPSIGNENEWKMSIQKEYNKLIQKRIPFLLWQTSTSAVQLKYLENLGLQSSETIKCLIAVPEVYDFTKKEITVQRVKSASDYNQYIQILSNGFQLTDAVQNTFRKLLIFGQDSVIQHYIAYVNQSPASILTTFEQDSTLGIYCLATLKEYENLGLASTLIAEVFKEAKIKGFKYCVMHTANEVVAKGIAQKFNFEENGEILTFIYR